MDGSDARELRLDFAHCERVRYARDPAFDGLIFIAVTSTRIYCRPVCPVRQPLSKNVRYYPSAAAAEAAGFRPCLRCRPETAVRSPAWNGARATVDRALRLIENGALDEGGVEALAERLGVGARHLSRLFRAHLGSGPLAVARTARVQRAKRLIDSTDLGMTEIAAQAGFASLRSFNATFREVYRCAPSELRRRRRQPSLARSSSEMS
jgi:AraC family transcriptional regulator, regulatory protein of adaptative response / methylated-DNA-[protein]-cysteine methyltransferase